MRNLKEEILDKLADSNKYIEADMLRIEKELSYEAMEEYALTILKHFINNKWDFDVKGSDIEEVLKVVESDLIRKLPKIKPHRINFNL